MESLRRLSRSLLNYGYPTKDEEAVGNGELVEALPMTSADYATGVNQFVTALFQQVSWTRTGFRDNVLLAPISVHSILAILHVGSKGRTRAELEYVLHLATSGGLKRAAQHYRDFRNGLVNREGNDTLVVATKLYHDPSLEPSVDVLGALDSAVEKIDFRSATNVAREAINRWVENQTERQISELIPMGNRYVREDTRLVIVGATYFRGAWSSRFDRSATAERNFHVRPDLRVLPETMQQTDTFPFASDPELDCTALELPYAGGRMCLIVLLPDQKTYLEHLVAKLDRETFERLRTQLTSTLVKVALPKFRIAGQSTELMENVKALGVQDLFDRERADLPGFGGRGFFASFVLHKAVFGVTEDGTVELPANDASNHGLKRQPSSANKKQPKEFFVDRPFAFFLYDKDAAVIVFSGLIRDPTRQN